MDRNLSEDQCQDRENQNCNWYIARDSVLTTQSRTLRGPSYRRLPQYYEIYLQELNQVLTVNIRKRSPHASSRKRRKGII